MDSSNWHMYTILGLRRPCFECSRSFCFVLTEVAGGEEETNEEYLEEEGQPSSKVR